MLRYWIIITLISAALAATPSFSASRLPIVHVQTVNQGTLSKDAMGDGAVAEDTIAKDTVADEQGQITIKPSEAALIAKNAYPDAKVLSVKLLPSGDYAVTLRVGGSVQRVLVNATTGALG